MNNDLHALAAWGSYLYPGTQTLRNKLDLHDPTELRRVEHEHTRWRSESLPAVDISLEGLQDMHRHLFGDIYEWAGELRYVDMQRSADHPSQSDITFAAHDTIKTQGQEFFKTLHGYGPIVDLEDFGQRAGWLTGGLNRLHPFRDGNGRTMRAFLTQWASHEPYPTDFTIWTKHEWMAASHNAFHGNYDPTEHIVTSYHHRLTPDQLQAALTDWNQTGTPVALTDSLNEDATWRGLAAQHLPNPHLDDLDLTPLTPQQRQQAIGAVQQFRDAWKIDSSEPLGPASSHSPTQALHRAHIDALLKPALTVDPVAVNSPRPGPGLGH